MMISNPIKICRSILEKIKLALHLNPDTVISRNQKFSRKIQNNIRKIDSCTKKKCHNNLKRSLNQSLKNNRYIQYVEKI